MDPNFKTPPLQQTAAEISALILKLQLFLSSLPHEASPIHMQLKIQWKFIYIFRDFTLQKSLLFSPLIHSSPLSFKFSSLKHETNKTIPFCLSSSYPQALGIGVCAFMEKLCKWRVHQIWFPSSKCLIPSSFCLLLDTLVVSNRGVFFFLFIQSLSLLLREEDCPTQAMPPLLLQKCLHCPFNDIFPA